MTLETAKKLKEAGWDKSVSHIYAISGSGKSQIFRATPFINAKIKETEYYYPCPSLEELLSEMPDKICGLGKVDLFFKLGKYDETYFVEYQYDGQRLYFHSDPDPTEAVAQLYIKLKQENLL